MNRRSVRMLCGAVLLATALGAFASAPRQPAEASPAPVVVSATDRDGVTVTLAAGTYVFTVSGTYGYGPGSADAECSDQPPDPLYVPNRWILTDQTNDLLDIYVNGENVQWQPTNGSPLGCNTDNHTYTLTHVQETADDVTFRIIDPGYDDNSGSITVTITEEVQQHIETVSINSAVGYNTTTAGLDPAKTYRFDASGSYSFGLLPVTTADVECSGVGPAGAADTFSTALTPFDTTDDLLDLYVNYLPVTWRPTGGSPAGCDPDHRYSLEFRPQSDAPIVFSLRDDNTGDNAGSLTVEIYEIANPPQAALPGLPEIELAESVSVDSRSSTGAFSAVPMREGEQVLMEVSGTYGWGLSSAADAECSNRLDRPDPVWRRAQDFSDFGVPADETLLDVLVNGEAQDWTATQPDAQGCNTTTHTYRLVYVPNTTGLMNFRVNDGNLNDNVGTLTVKIFRVGEIPIGAVTVDAANPQGTSIPLLGDRTYRLRVSGTYSYGIGTADAECSNRTSVVNGDPVYRRTRDFRDLAPTLAPNDSVLDLLVASSPVDWEPVTADAETCNSTDHRYDALLTTTETGLVNLRVLDLGYNDNAGALTVEIFLQAD